MMIFFNMFLALLPSPPIKKTTKKNSYKMIGPGKIDSLMKRAKVRHVPSLLHYSASVCEMNQLKLFCVI